MERSLIEISLISGFIRNIGVLDCLYESISLGALHKETIAISSSSSVLVSLLANLLGMGRL
jgi:hypothetical protein